MPFKSKAQRRFLYARHPDIAERWSAEYGSGAKLPEHVRTRARSALARRRAQKKQGSR